jgi:uncharacterized iron-regulated protein
VQVKNGKTVTMQDLAKDLGKYDIIFFGEFHDNQALHRMQRELLPFLEGKRELILSFEMFERDVQEVLTDYVEGRISEEEFIQNSRPWPNYDTDYRPLVDYAKERKLNAVAANVPRVYAGKLARQGADFIDELEGEERALLAARLTAPEDDYRKAFFSLMGGESSPMHAMNNSMQPLYQAQCLKDDTMAESIVLALKAKPNARLIHYNGAFHSHAFLGTVSRVKEALPKQKIAVISPVYSADWKTVQLSSEDKQAGTYIIYLPEPKAGGEE